MAFTPYALIHGAFPQWFYRFFFGYLGASAAFAVSNAPQINVDARRASLIRQLLYGVFVVFVVGSAALIGVYVFTNDPRYAEPDTGMSMEVMAGGFAVLLSLMSLTTNVIVGYLFSTAEGEVTRIQAPGIHKDE